MVYRLFDGTQIAAALQGPKPFSRVKYSSVIFPRMTVMLSYAGFNKRPLSTLGITEVIIMSVLCLRNVLMN